MVLSKELDTNIPVSCGYHCTVSTLNLCTCWLDLHRKTEMWKPHITCKNTLKSENIILPSGGHWITVDENGVILTCPLCRLLCKCIEASCCCFPSHRSQLRHQIHLTTYWNANQTRNLLYLLSCCCKGSSQEKNCVLHANIRKCEFYGYSTLTIFHQ